MNNHSLRLIKDSLELLRQIQRELHHQPIPSLSVKLDEAIEILESIESSRVMDRGLLLAALRAIGQGLAFLPAIAKVIRHLDKD